ncbi:hypothetical protein SMD20_26680 [Nonomuraea sp. LP-02]|uniref:hypothetical protein n=1 Tax=Nonomuraea sp. LP-02 TaxID=3097960 RepID=UPI002E312904|nr:hypothetical protein [Nonomuraea sp. LP-02]MED7927873.1 hypothetical protein [Nonomuraea sp. LP-02]
MNWSTLWTWVTENISVDRASLLVAFLAVLVALRSARHAQRSAWSAEIQARAAEVQAEAAKRQVEVAERALWDAYTTNADRIAEVSALSDYRSFLESVMPKVAVRLEPTRYPPIRRKHDIRCERGQEYPKENAHNDFIVYHYRENSFDRLEFFVRGTLVNVGNISAEILTHGPKFIEGRSALLPTSAEIPQQLESGSRYLLPPDGVALFEWHISLLVNQWMDIYKEHHRGEFELDDDWKADISSPSTSFYVKPAGSAVNEVMRIRLNLDDNVIWPAPARDYKQPPEWYTYKEGPVYIYVNHEYPALPQDLEDMRKVLKRANPWTGRVED